MFRRAMYGFLWNKSKETIWRLNIAQSSVVNSHGQTCEWLANSPN